MNLKLTMLWLNIPITKEIQALEQNKTWLPPEKKNLLDVNGFVESNVMHMERLKDIREGLLQRDILNLKELIMLTHSLQLLS